MKRCIRFWYRRHIWNPTFGIKSYGLTGESESWVVDVIIRSTYVPGIAAMLNTPNVLMQRLRR